jgi:N-acetylmuramoyl-L-alanine amidase
MRNSGGPGSFDGTYSDYSIYPGEGFAVLRNTNIPAVLVECGFHTNTHEEKRIVQDEFNRIQAWGIFRGLCRYFYAGVPVIEFISPLLPVKEGNITCEFRLIDSTGIDSSSINILFDTIKTDDYIYSKKTGITNVNIDSVSAGSHTIKITAVNKNGNHTYSFHQEIKVFK